MFKKILNRSKKLKIKRFVPPQVMKYLSTHLIEGILHYQLLAVDGILDLVLTVNFYKMYIIYTTKCVNMQVM